MKPKSLALEVKMASDSQPGEDRAGPGYDSGQAAPLDAVISAAAAATVGSTTGAGQWFGSYMFGRPCSSWSLFSLERAPNEVVEFTSLEQGHIGTRVRAALCGHRQTQV